MIDEKICHFYTFDVVVVPPATSSVIGRLKRTAVRSPKVDILVFFGNDPDHSRQDAILVFCLPLVMDDGLLRLLSVQRLIVRSSGVWEGSFPRSALSE